MFNFSDLLGAMIQQGGMSRSTNDRLQNALGAGGPATGGGLADLLGSSGLGSAITSLFGSSSGSGGAGGLGSMLAGVLGDAGQAVGGNQNLALGGLGALAGSLLGGGGDSVKGAVGGGALAVLGAMAYSALTKARQQPSEVPLGVREPQSEEEQQKLESHAELILKAMVNAAKADGQIDKGEVQRIVGKLQEAGANVDARDFIISEMSKPMDLESLTAAARGNPQLAAQLYAASIIAIEVDTPSEREYLNNLADKLGLDATVVKELEQHVGIS